MTIYIFLSLFIISHICFEENLKKRIMMLGVFSLIYIVEEMITAVCSFIIFKYMWLSSEVSIYYLIFKLCITNLQLLSYCFIVEKLFTRELNHLKQFYLIPIGQTILLLMLYYLGVLKCQTILGYIFIIFALLIIWCDYILYQAFLSIREEKISDIKYEQSKAFTNKQATLRKLRHDLLNHYEVIEIMIKNNDQQGVSEYMDKLKVMYEDIGGNENDI